MTKITIARRCLAGGTRILIWLLRVVLTLLVLAMFFIGGCGVLLGLLVFASSASPGLGGHGYGWLVPACFLGGLCIVALSGAMISIVWEGSKWVDTILEKFGQVRLLHSHS